MFDDESQTDERTDIERVSHNIAVRGTVVMANVALQWWRTLDIATHGAVVMVDAQHCSSWCCSDGGPPMLQFATLQWWRMPNVTTCGATMMADTQRCKSNFIHLFFFFCCCVQVFILWLWVTISCVCPYCDGGIQVCGGTMEEDVVKRATFSLPCEVLGV